MPNAPYRDHGTDVLKCDALREGRARLASSPVHQLPPDEGPGATVTRQDTEGGGPSITECALLDAFPLRYWAFDSPRVATGLRGSTTTPTDAMGGRSRARDALTRQMCLVKRAPAYGRTGA